MHKLVTAEHRIAAFQTKTKKDIFQAEQLISVLVRDRPGDLRRAWTAAKKQPAKFIAQLHAGAKRLPKETQAALKRTVGDKN